MKKTNLDSTPIDSGAPRLRAVVGVTKWCYILTCAHMVPHDGKLGQRHVRCPKCATVAL